MINHKYIQPSTTVARGGPHQHGSAGVDGFDPDLLSISDPGRFASFKHADSIVRGLMLSTGLGSNSVSSHRFLKEIANDEDGHAELERRMRIVLHDGCYAGDARLLWIQAWIAECDAAAKAG